MGVSASPYLRARAVYEQEPCARDFDTDLRTHLEQGYVISTPALFLMGRPVSRSHSPEFIVDPRMWHENPDCWHIYLAVGDLREFFRHEPFPLPWFSWERDNRLRFYRRERLCQLIQRLIS